MLPSQIQAGAGISGPVSLRPYSGMADFAEPGRRIRGKARLTSRPTASGPGHEPQNHGYFVHLATVTRSDCILAFPAYYHNGVLFSRYFRFINPEKEGEVQAIRRTFSHMSIRQLAWAVHLNFLRTASGAVYEWKAEEQVFPWPRTSRTISIRALQRCGQGGHGQGGLHHRRRSLRKEVRRDRLSRSGKI